MVKEGPSVLGSIPENGSNSAVDPSYGQALKELSAELLARAKKNLEDAAGRGPEAKVISEASAGILCDLAAECPMPYVRRLGMNVDVWEERIEHLREFVNQYAENLAPVLAAQAGIGKDDPRRQRLSEISGKIASNVREELESSLQTVVGEAAAARPYVR